MGSRPNRICVYCGAAEGSRAAYLAAARNLGAALGARGIELVYGGGHVGMMGALADAALAAGGRVTGVIPQQLVDRELGHRAVSELRIVQSMHERKLLMAELSDAFLALPGGWGTLDELTEMLTWLQLGFHQKPIGIVNVAGYFDALLAFEAHMEREGFLRKNGRHLFISGTEPIEVLDSLLALSD
jgi:uncharacterized protein (TIGR00730 family)